MQNVSEELNVIMIHGGPSFYGYMHTLAELLPAWVVTQTYAQRGTITKPLTTDHLTMEDHFEDLDAVIRDFSKVEPVVLIGHSWGANLALLYAASRPKQIAQVVSVGPAPLTPSGAEAFGATLMQRCAPALVEELKDIEAAMQNLLESDGDAAELNALAERRLSLMQPSYHFDADCDARIPRIAVDFKGFLASQAALWRLIDEGTIESRLKSIRCPVLHLHGRDDPIPAHSTGAFLQSHIERYSSVFFDQCGHFPWLESGACELFLETLSSSLSNVMREARAS